MHFNKRTPEDYLEEAFKKVPLGISLLPTKKNKGVQDPKETPSWRRARVSDGSAGNRDTVQEIAAGVPAQVPPQKEEPGVGVERKNRER